MAMMTSVIALSRNIMYWMACDDSTFFCNHNYYINLYVRHHFILVVMDNFRPYVVPSLIPVDDYVHVQYFPYRIFILCLYVELDHFFSGINLVHIYNILLG